MKEATNMGDKEYKKFDSDAKMLLCGMRLCKDAESRDGTHGKMVRLTVCVTSRKENYSDLWIEVNVGDFNAEMASFLKKGDILHKIFGQMSLRTFGDDNEKFSVICDRAEITAPNELFATLKERGWVPGQKSDGKKPAGKDKKKSGNTNGKPTTKPAAKKPAPIEIPDDEDDNDGDDDDNDE